MVNKSIPTTVKFKKVIFKVSMGIQSNLPVLVWHQACSTDEASA